jgi:hypothetical protein
MRCIARGQGYPMPLTIDDAMTVLGVVGEALGKAGHAGKDPA